MTQKKTAKPIVTKRGVGRYLKLRRADTKFNENGIYSAEVIMSPEDAEVTINECRKVWKELTGKAISKAQIGTKPKIWYEETDDEGEPTGRVVLKFSVKNIMPKRGANAGKLWDRKPTLVDAKRKPLPADVDPSSGSDIRLCVTPELSDFNDTKMVKFVLTSVQVLKLVTYDGDVDDGSAFDIEDDGYEAPDDTGSAFDDDEDDQIGTDADLGDDEDF